MKKLCLILILAACAQAQFIVPGTVTPSTVSSNIAFSTCTASTATISYGLTGAYGSSLSDMSAVTAHSFSLSGLASGTTYHYKISSTDGNGNIVAAPDQTFKTTAVVISSAVSITPASLAFLNGTVGTASAVQYGTVAATSGSVTITSGFTFSGSTEFKFGGSGTCKVGQVLTQGQGCTFGITFTPTATGSHSASLSINDSATGSPQAVPLTGTIKGATPPPPVHSASLAWLLPSQIAVPPNAAPVVTAVNVYRSSGGTFSLLTTLGSTATSYQDSAVTAGQTYQYQVTTFAGGNVPANQESVPSAAVTAAIPSP